MRDGEEKQKREWVKKRDKYQSILEEARKSRADIKFSVRDKHREIEQKIGELSLLLGAAVLPLVLASHKTINHINYLLAGVGIYLLTGLVTIWIIKTRIEIDSNDADLVSLDEQIMIYPLTNALNKMIHDPSVVDYAAEYEQAKKLPIESLKNLNKKHDITFEADFILTSFIIATLLTARSAWPYTALAYWITFALALAVIFVAAIISYTRANSSRATALRKQATIDQMRNDFQSWRDRNQD